MHLKHALDRTAPVATGQLISGFWVPSPEAWEAMMAGGPD